MEDVALPAVTCRSHEYAVASRTLYGERQSGDAALVQATADGVLVAVVDGLGHGDEAAAASDAAIGILRGHAGQAVDELLQRCHETLQQTRGAAVALAAFDSARATLTWSGVGNVEGILIPSTAVHPARSKQYLTNRSGVVGYRLPVVQASVVPICPGDLLILATDGIDERFVASEMPHGSTDRLARAILERYGKASDDALVLVLRWLGGDPGTALYAPS